jgi:hypothetical protein
VPDRVGDELAGEKRGHKLEVFMRVQLGERLDLTPGGLGRRERRR